MKQVKYVERIQVANGTAFFFEILTDRAKTPFLRITQIQDDYNGISQTTVIQIPSQSEYQFLSAVKRSYEQLEKLKAALIREEQQLAANRDAWKPKQAS